MIGRYLDCSTAHITKNDDALLTEGVDIRYDKHAYGYWIYVVCAEDDDGENVAVMQEYGFSKGFIELHQFAQKHRCGWIKLDRDGCDIPELKQFDWS